ncbi:CCA tRNA nucleotidyltransferase [Halobacteriales archaeon QS_1_68_20]|nr:MAG: CCA tRNA nucleotidyltransferase [Halobacteriales archaeon QS_1_68_20]
MSDEAFEAVVAAVRERVDPEADERERLRAVAEEVIDRAEAAAAALPVETDAVQVGSTARGTWLAGDRDVDVFVRFPPDLPREKLESYGLEVGREVLPDGHEEYAEHPYVVGEFDGFQVDLVPCYRVPDATEIQSAVDRTPFHTRYLDERLDEDLAAEVRAFKQFCKGIGVYGSDLRTRGLSGYLTELLVLAYGGFRETLEAAADWQPPVRLDPADHGRAGFDDPLVVIDPTDPERNVAAVTSATNVARLQHHARAFLADPTVERCVPDDPDPLSAAAVSEHVDRRSTTPVAVRFDAPDLVDDQLYPQLRKSLSGVADELDRRGFDVFRTATWAADGGGDGPDDTSDGDSAGDANPAVLLVELAVAERPRVERHEGPPVHVRQHAEGFYEKYDDEDAYGPFVDGDRYVVERDREFPTARAFLESDALLDVALGVHVEEALADGYDVLVGGEVAELAGEFGVELARYVEPSP